MPIKYINILFISGFSLSSRSLISLYPSLTPLFLPLLYHLSVSPLYHYHSPDSRFTLQSTELHRDQTHIKTPDRRGGAIELEIGSGRFLGSVLWLLLTRLVVVADLLVGFFVVDEIGVVGFFVCVCFFFLPLLVVLVVAISCGCWL